MSSDCSCSVSLPHGANSSYKQKHKSVRPPLSVSETAHNS